MSQPSASRVSKQLILNYSELWNNLKWECISCDKIWRLVSKSSTQQNLTQLNMRLFQGCELISIQYEQR